MDLERREFLTNVGMVFAVASVVPAADTRSGQQPAGFDRSQSSAKVGDVPARAFNDAYRGEQLERVAFPLGGIGAGMICLEGNGALTQFSLRHAPDLVNEPLVFAAIAIKGSGFAKVLEGPVPEHKKFARFAARDGVQSAWGLPRFQAASFTARFPFAQLDLKDDSFPIEVTLNAWSPFEPGQEDDASLPVAGLEYQLSNRGDTPVEAVLSFNAGNFMYDYEGSGGIRSLPGGFIFDGTLKDKPWTAGSFAVTTDEPGVKVNHAWFRGAGSLWMVWRDIETGACFDRPPVLGADMRSRAPGASLFIPFALKPGESKKIVLRLGWYCAQSNLRLSGGGMPDFNWYERKDNTTTEECYRPWYAAQYPTIKQLMSSWADRYPNLREGSRRFSDAFYDSTLPPELLEAVAANLTILKSPTVLRQADGRFWAWEGSADEIGSCNGSCTHVWNYAQALSHLFPRLERTLRDTEFGPSQDDKGHQAFRAPLPIRPAPHEFYAAADGQLGGVIKTYREWRVSGETVWLRTIWPRVRASLDYCIRTWDPRRVGWLEEPHHNTYDIEFWGPDGMCTSIYLGALQAAVRMGVALGDDVSDYRRLFTQGVHRMESELFNGEYFQQNVTMRGLQARYPPKEGMYRSDSPEGLALAEREGPQNQYGAGCLSDGILGAWLAWACGLGSILDDGKIASHLNAVYRYNFKHDLSVVANPTSSRRAAYGLGREGGLLLCTWPRGERLSIPFPYACEVWTGVEYQVASHLISIGRVDEGIQVVRAARQRYDGRIRNPFDEVEAGHWYARAMSSYALLQAYSGACYDAVDQVLYLNPPIKGDFRCFLSTASGYGTAGVKNGAPFVEVASGAIPFKTIQYTAAA